MKLLFREKYWVLRNVTKRGLHTIRHRPQFSRICVATENTVKKALWICQKTDYSNEHIWWITHYTLFAFRTNFIRLFLFRHSSQIVCSGLFAFRSISRQGWHSQETLFVSNECGAARTCTLLQVAACGIGRCRLLYHYYSSQYSNRRSCVRVPIFALVIANSAAVFRVESASDFSASLLALIDSIASRIYPAPRSLCACLHPLIVNSRLRQVYVVTVCVRRSQGGAGHVIEFVQVWKAFVYRRHPLVHIRGLPIQRTIRVVY